MRRLIIAAIVLVALPAAADTYLINDVRIFNGVDEELTEGNVLVEDGLIAQVSGDAIAAPDGATVIDGNGIEFLGHSTGRMNFACDQSAQLFQVHVTGDKLGKRVGNGNNGFAEILFAGAGGAPQGARRGPQAPLRSCIRSQFHFFEYQIGLV